VTSEKALTKVEKNRLAELEAVIDRELPRFEESGTAIGVALVEICDSKLYRQTHSTFEAYVRERFDKSRQWAYQLIDAAAVSSVLDKAGLPAIRSRRALLELLPVLRHDGDEAVVEVVREMLAEHGESLTAPKVREALQSAATGKNGWRTPKPDGDEWFTPAKYVEAARGVLGGIDLDPASKALAQETVQAARYYSLIERGEDGLALPWAGRMFLNPPFSKAKLFGPKLLREYEAGNVQSIAPPQSRPLLLRTSSGSVAQSTFCVRKLSAAMVWLPDRARR